MDMAETVFRCITCNAEMADYRHKQFPICNECLNIIKKLIADKKLEDIAEKLVAKITENK
jgi:hypothetical protein